MWLYVPYQSAPDRPALSLDLNLPEWPSLPLLMSNAKPTPLPISGRRSKRAPFRQLLSGTTSTPSAMQSSAISWRASNWTSSPAATLVSPSALPENGLAKMILDTYGRPLLERLSSIGRERASLKTSQLTFGWDTKASAPTFDDLVTRRRKEYSRRANLARAIGGSGCLSWLWATPAAADHTGSTGGRMDKSLRTDVAHWPTPHGMGNVDRTGKKGGAGGGEFAKVRTQWPTPNVPNRGSETKESKDNRPNAGGIDLQTTVQLWPTPAARDSRSGEASETTHTRNARPLNEVACRSSRQDPATSTDGEPSSPKTPTLRPRLNPAFVEWLMGLPPRWTDIEATDYDSAETPLSRWSRRMRGYFSGLICSLGASE